MAGIFGFDLGFGIGPIGGGAFGIFFLVVIAVWIMRQNSEHDALYGRSDERRLEREEGMGSAAKTIKDIENFLNQQRQREKADENRLKADSNQEKKRGEPKSEKDVNQAAIEDTQAAENEEDVERDTAALEGRSIGMITSIKAALSSVANYIARVRPSTQREEQDIQALENLMRSLNNTGNFAAIDERVANYLKAEFEKMAEAIARSVTDEKQKEEYHGELVKRLREVAKEAQGVIGGAKTALNKLMGREKKERKNFKKGIDDILKALNDKKRELDKIRRSKEADPSVVAQLKREVALLQQHRDLVNRLNSELQNTYHTMDRELKEMKGLLKAVTGTEKQLRSHEANADKREKAIEKRYSELDKLAKKLEESFEGMAENQGIVHQFAIGFSGKLNEFYSRYGEIITGDLVFDDEVRKILLLNITITRQMEAQERLNASLEQAEEAVDKGLIASEDIIAAIVGGQDQKANLKNLTEVVKKAGGGIDYAARVEQFLQQLTKTIEQGELEVTTQIAELENEDKRLLGEINNANQGYSSAIGRTMATMMQRKEQIDSKYMGQVRQFEQQLEDRNAIAARAYRQARGFEARARNQQPSTGPDEARKRARLQTLRQVGFFNKPRERIGV